MNDLQPPFKKGDVLAWHSGRLFCFVAVRDSILSEEDRWVYEHHWKENEWIYGDRPIDGCIRKATSADLIMWMGRLSTEARNAMSKWTDALYIVSQSMAGIHVDSKKQAEAYAELRESHTLDMKALHAAHQEIHRLHQKLDSKTRLQRRNI